MKKKTIALALVLVTAVMFCACGKSNKKLALAEKTDTIKMKMDEKYTVKLSAPKDAVVEWVSDDETIAVVSPDGTVSAVGSGVTVLTARSEGDYLHIGVIVEGDGSYTDEFGNHVEVFDGVSDITEISVGVRGGGKDDVSVKVGETFRLRAYTDPSDSKDKIVWRTENALVAKVDEEGNLKATGIGKTTITAYAPNGVKGEMIVRVK